MLRRTTALLSLALLAGCGGGDPAEDAAKPIRSDTLVVYSSLPRTGASASAGNAVAAGQRLALADAAGRAGRHRVRLVVLDSGGARERDWDPDRVEENAERAADDPAAIAYLGELELGASAVSLPVTNKEGILQVSPEDGLSSLTLAQPGPGAGPERFYPTKTRTFLRLVPPDSAQAGSLAALARRLGADRIAIAHDDGIAGRQLAGAVEQAATDRGIEVTGVERVEPDPAEAGDLARALAAGDPDAVVYLGTGGDPANTILAAMAARPLASRPLIAAGPAALKSALARGTASQAEVVSPILPARCYPAAGRRVLARLSRDTGERAPVEALYGYESMRLALAAIDAAGSRASQRQAVIDAARRDGPAGSVIGPYRLDDRGDTSRRSLGLYRTEDGRLAYRGAAPGSRGAC